MKRLVFLICCALFLYCAPSFIINSTIVHEPINSGNKADANNADIQGIVKDSIIVIPYPTPIIHPVKHAQITITDINHNNIRFKTISTDDGRFSFYKIPIGKYSLKVKETSGYRSEAILFNVLSDSTTFINLSSPNEGIE